MKLLLLVGAIALVGCGNPPASDDGGVPADFVRTPFGYFHPSCIAATDASGNRPLVITDCAYEHYSLHHDIAADAASSDGWKSSEWFQTTPLYWVSATWTVPAAPTLHAEQTLYYFPSLEPNTYDDIVQPVLAWNGYGDQAWTMTSWNCCETGNVWHSNPVTVKTGDAVWGQAAGGNCSATTGVCSSWQIISGDTTTNQTTTLNATSNEIFTAAQGGVLETYGVTDCRELAKSVKFTNILVGAVGGKAVRPTWTPDIASVSPDCKYTATASTSTRSSTVTVGDKP